MNRYTCESNSRRIVEMFRRSMEAQARIEGRQSKIIVEDEKRLVIQSGMNWVSLEAIIGGIRSKLLVGEEFWGTWPGGTFDSRSYDPIPATRKKSVSHDDGADDDCVEGDEWKNL
jgi:hypothetical protein